MYDNDCVGIIYNDENGLHYWYVTEDANAELANKTRFDFPGRYMQVALARCCLSPKTQAPAISLLTHPEFVV